MRVPLVFTVLVAAFAARAELVVWTNANNGNWNVAGNWHPNRVPSTNDTVIITNAGAYTVTLNVNPTVDAFVLGGASGTQTLATAGHTLTLSGESVVNTNGWILLAGWISGTNHIHLAGGMTWQYGSIDTNTALTVAKGGRVDIVSGATHAKFLYGCVTNAGTILWQPVGNLHLGATLHNLTGGVFEATMDYSLLNAGSNAVFINEGVFRKSTGSGTLACYVPFVSAGTVDTQTGELRLQDGSTLNSGCAFTGAGVTRLNSGTNRLNGVVYSENLVFSGTVLAGTGTLNGTMTWSSGTLDAGASLTVVSNATLNISSGANYTKLILGNLTNAGTIAWQPIGYLNIGGALHNLAGGLFDARVDNISILTTGSNATIINDGVFRKSEGNYTVGCYVPTLNRGTVEVFPGTLRFYSGFTNPLGTIALSGGTFRPGGSLFLDGGQLTGWGTMLADVINDGAICPARSNGVLTVQGTYEQALSGRVEFELAGNIPGTNQSRLNITGAATLRGTLSVRWADGYVPEPGTNYPVMTFGSRRGEFAGCDWCILLGQGRRLTPLYSSTAMTLATETAPEPTTVPLRLVVDGDALICWPAEFTGYELYCSTNLAGTNWTWIPGVTNRFLDAAPLLPQKFFRLGER